MNFNVISLMPDMVESILQFGVVGAAFKKEICHLKLINPRQFTSDIHQTVDDRPFGGGDGMLMMAEPLQKALDSTQASEEVIYLSPQGELFDEKMAKQLSVKSNITLVCGRYGGVDQRFLNKNKLREVSIGDYVLSGGELAAAVMIDSICRKIPGVLGHVASASEDSFADGLLEAPYFTRPQEWQGMGVPQVLLSGDHKKVAEFRKMVSIVTTLQKRPDLLGDHLFSVGDKREINWSSAYNYFTQWTESQWQEVGLDANQVLNQIKERLTNG